MKPSADAECSGRFFACSEASEWKRGLEGKRLLSPLTVATRTVRYSINGYDRVDTWQIDPVRSWSNFRGNPLHERAAAAEHEAPLARRRRSAPAPARCQRSVRMKLPHPPLGEEEPSPPPQRRPRGFASGPAAPPARRRGEREREREREREKERTKLRERHRRAITSRMLAGLRQHGNFSLPARADMNDVLAALARAAGWTVHPDGTTFRSSNQPPLPPPPQLVRALSPSPSSSALPHCLFWLDACNLVSFVLLNR